MKTILAIENNLSQQQTQSFSSHHYLLFQQFLLNPDQYTRNSQRTSSIEHQDGITERWQITLTENFKLFIDCGISKPWAASQSHDFYSIVIVIGFDAGADNFYLP